MLEHLEKSAKAYYNHKFLGSPSARSLRLLSEYLEPLDRLNKNGIKDTIVFFGSARIKSSKDAKKELYELTRASKNSNSSGKKSKDKNNKDLELKIEDAKSNLKMSKYYTATEELAYLLTKWSMSLSKGNKFVVCSGGGPGIMEAANKGAKKAGGLSIGLNISLPFEQYPNPYITPELNFEFHYFFMRKFWFAYLAKAVVIMPGGFGTLDEFMEVLTLVQTFKLRKKMDLIVYDENFWNEIVNFKALAKYNMISKEDLSLFKFANTPEEAFNYLKKGIKKNYVKYF